MTNNSASHTNSIGDSGAIFLATFVVLSCVGIIYALYFVFKKLFFYGTNMFSRVEIRRIQTVGSTEAVVQVVQLAPELAPVVNLRSGFVPLTNEPKTKIPDAFRHHRIATEDLDHSTRGDLEFKVHSPQGEIVRARVVLWYYPGRQQVRRTLYPVAKSVKKLLGEQSVTLAPMSFPPGARKADVEARTRAEVDVMLQPQPAKKRASSTAPRNRQASESLEADSIPQTQELSDVELCQEDDFFIGTQIDYSAVEALPWEILESVDPAESGPLLEKPQQAALVSFSGKLVAAKMMDNSSARTPYRGYCVIIHDESLNAEQAHWGADLQRAIKDSSATPGDRVRLSVIGETASKVANGRSKKIWDCTVLTRRS